MNNLPELKQNFGVSLAQQLPNVALPKLEAEAGWFARKKIKRQMRDFRETMALQAEAAEDMVRVSNANDQIMINMMTFSDRCSMAFFELDHAKAMMNMDEYIKQMDAKKKAHEAEMAEYEARKAKLECELFERKMKDELNS